MKRRNAYGRWLLVWFTVAGLLCLACGPDIAVAMTLSKAEKAYLEKKKTITFVSQTRYPPFEFVDKNAEHTGMCIELARWMATELGFKARFADMAFQDAQQALIEGKADVLTSLFYSNKRDRRFDFTQVIFRVPASIFVNPERPDINDVYDLNRKRIAMQAGDYAGEYLQSKGIGFDVVYTTDFAKATDLVIAGKADAIIGDEQIVLYHIFQNGLTDKIKKVGEPLYVGQNCMATRQGDQVLVGILNKGLNLARQNGIIEKITKKWLGTRYTLGESLLFKYLPVLSAAAGMLLILALMAWLWNLRLHRQVNIRTQELRISEERFRTIYDAVNDAIFVHDMDTGAIVDVNRRMCEMYGYTREEAMQLRDQIPKSGVPPYTQEEALRWLKKAAEGESPLFEWHAQNKSGEQFWVEVNMRRALIGNQDQILVVARDITERKHAQEASLREKERFRVLVERSPFGVALIGADGRYKYINPKFVDIFHYTLEDIRSGRDWFNKAFPDPEYRKQAITSWQEDLKPPEDMESGVYREFDVRCKDDSTKRILFRNVNLQSGEQLVFYEDITEKRRLEAHLLHAQKLESMGTLTSGVAHNFRNILAGISMNAQLAKLKYAGVQGLTDVVERIDDSVSAGSQLVEELMAFSRKKTGQGFQLINLSTIIRDTCQLIRASFDKKIQIQIHAPMDLCIHGDPSGLGQVFMNLCTNARDAMPDGGELRIEAEKAGRQAVVVISDTGHGMDKESREKCFDPFFTTKDVDKGTGLGLWTAYGIVKHHGGQIHVSSEPGKGATFKLCFHLASSNETIIDRPEASTVRGKGQKVLIVDDETDIAFPLKELLENMGYQATHVPSGQAALDTYATWRPDAVLIDRNMPGMDGITCMRKLMKLDPSARTILISGYQETGPDGIDAQTRSLIKAYLTKPIHVADLGRILTQLFEPADDVASS